MHCLDFLDKGRRHFGANVLARDEERQISYNEAWALSGHIASALVAQGVLPGARVATFTHNNVLALACQYGALRAGAVWVPLNFRNTLDETRNLLERYGVEWLFVDAALASGIAPLLSGLSHLRGATCLDGGTPLPDLNTWLSSHEPDRVLPTLRPQEPAVILTTSGTTGEPKGALHSHRSWATMIAAYEIAMRFDESPVHLVVAPLSHAAGCLHWTVLSRGGTNVLLSHAGAGEVLAAIAACRANLLFLPPTVIYMMLAHAELTHHDYSSLRYFLYGAAPMSVDKLREAIAAFGPVMAQSYGQSEALMMCTYLSPEEHVEALRNPAATRRIASAGREGPLCRVEIMSDHGVTLGPETPGEIVCRSEFVMDSYFEQPAATAEVSQFGWHHTGDVGFRDADGFIYIIDRKRDLIISGGFNVYPGEVEQTALAFPAVQDCAVVGEPHDKWGEAVLAVVQVKPDAPWDPVTFLAFCRERLGGVKAPKRVEVWPELPRSAVGKVLRREVRAKFWAGHDRAI